MCAKSIEAARFVVNKIMELQPKLTDVCYKGVLVGGMKNSGVGREGGWEALRFFTEPKNVCIKY